MRLLFQDPGVFAAAALRGVDDERAFFEGYAGQAAGDDVDLVAEEDVGPQIDVARLQAIADEAGSAGEVERGLGDVVARDWPRSGGRTPRAAAAVECGPINMP